MPAYLQTAAEKTKYIIVGPKKTVAVGSLLFDSVCVMWIIGKSNHSFNWVYGYDQRDVPK